jgi:hypothetical protein
VITVVTGFMPAEIPLGHFPESSMKTKCFLASLALCASSTAVASFGSPPGVQEIVAEQHQISRQVEAENGKYSRFTPEALARIAKAQATIRRLLEGAATVEDLNGNQKTELFNAIEQVRSVLAANDQDRLVCERERKTGSTMRVIRCETVAQRARIREDARTWKGDPSVCGQSSDGFDCGGNAR